MNFLAQYLAAVHRYTRIPVQGAMTGLPEPSRPAFMPGIGWLVGLVACVAFAMLSLLLRGGGTFEPLAAATGSTIATVLLTKAMHEESLAGVYGTLAQSLAILAKVSLIAVLATQSEAGVLVALFAAHTLSRLAAQAMPEPADRREISLGAAWCVPPVLLAIYVRGFMTGLLMVVLTALAWWVLKLLLTRRADGRAEIAAEQGMGTTQQICEIACYLGAAIA